MVAVLTLLIVLAISLVVVRFATVGLTLTGISRDLAQFQALSAFTRCGFTTLESEEIVNHPVRRRVVMHLMLLGNAGIILVITSMLQVFLAPAPEGDVSWWATKWARLLVLAVGVAALWGIASSRYVEKVMWKADVWALRHWADIRVKDYTRLLRLAHDYTVSELHVHDGDWLAGHTLAQLKLNSEGVLILGVERGDGVFIGTPRGDTAIKAGDSLILYGRQQTLVELDTRQAGLQGNLHHVIAVTRQIDVQEEEQRVIQSTDVEG